MITFDEFVTKLYTQLVKRHPEKNFSLELVQRILSLAQVDKVMQQEEQQEYASKRLLLRRLRMSGYKRHTIDGETIPFCYDHVFQSGIEGWIAGNGTGKSTLLKAIVWGLTGIEQHFKQDIQSWLEDIALEISIEHDIYTIRYYPRPEQPRVSGLIASTNLETILHGADEFYTVKTFAGLYEMQEAIDQFFSEKMGFISLKVNVLHEPYPEANPKKISWNIYSQALFIGSDYIDYLYPRSYTSEKPHQKTISLFLGLGSEEVLSILEMERNKAREKYKFESKRFLLDTQSVREKMKQFEAELLAINERLQAIEEGQSVLVDPTHINVIREQSAKYSRLVSDQALSLQNLLLEEREIRKDLDGVRRTCQALHENIRFKTFFSNLAIGQCPYCEQRISAESIEEEMENKRCRLCHNEIHTVDTIEVYETLLSEAKNKLKALEDASRMVKKNIREVNNTSKTYEAELAHWKSELQDISRQERAGFTQEMRSLYDQRGFLSGQLRQLQEQTEENHTQYLQELKDMQDILDEAYIEMQGVVWNHYARYWHVLEERTTELAKLFGVKDVELVSFGFGDHFDLSVRQGGKPIRFRYMEASERLRLKLALHIAMLIMRTTDGIGRHPGLLIIDAPGSAEMDEHHFQSILQGIITVKEQLGDQVQLLIASTREAMMSIGDAGRFEQYESGASIF